MLFEKVIDSPIGPLTLQGTAESLTALRFGSAQAGGSSCPLLEEAARQLGEYFAGQRQRFALPLSPAGTPFQRSVWCALQEVTYGQTASYRDIASRIGKPNACRAVGMANHRNPLPILIPCHRIIASDGSLTGYAGGLAAKEFLLKLEKTFA